MSGPKVDVAELRRQKQMLLNEAREKRKELFEKIRKYMQQIQNCILGELSAVMRDEAVRENCERIKELQKKYMDELREIMGQVQNGNELLDTEVLGGKSRRIYEEFVEKTKGDIEVLRERLKNNKEYQVLAEQRKALEKTTRINIVRLSSKELEKGAPPITEEDVSELVKTFEEKIGEFMQSTTSIGRHKSSILSLHQDLREIVQSTMPAERKEKRIKSLFADYEKMTELMKKENDEMVAYYEEYIKECFDLSVPTRSLSEFSGISELQDAVKTMKTLAETKLSKEYIKRQIDEVMMKHGYDVIRSDMLEQMNQNGQILYGVDNDTAINVFVSDENQVTMRVVGIGFDEQVSEAENERLYQQQCAFCSLHPQITAELEMRGIVLHTKKHQPPDRRFNKKIQVRKTNGSQTMSKAKKELKRTEIKMMHKE